MSKPVFAPVFLSRARRPRVSAVIDFTGFIRLYDMKITSTKARPATRPRMSDT